METSYPLRHPFIQYLCPAPKRHLQYLIMKLGLRDGLDIGCGGGSPLTSLRSSGFRSTGIDISADAIKASRARNTHDEYIVGDFRDFRFARKFDVVILSHVIEHFTRDQGIDVIRRVESLSERLVYIETPHGFIESGCEDLDHHPHQRHLSGWFPHDFEARGYTILGSGPRWFNPAKRYSVLGGLAVRSISRMVQWYYFYRPRRSAVIGAIRHVDERGIVRIL